MLAELGIALMKKWPSIPQELVDNFILSRTCRCATILAVRGDNTILEGNENDFFAITAAHSALLLSKRHCKIWVQINDKVILKP